MKLKKRYRLTIWRREPERPGTPAHWCKTDTRELDAKQADLLQGIATNMGWSTAYRWCDTGQEIAGRLITVERLP